MPLIKRYSNRKLYDTNARAYVTLDEIAEMIRAGEGVRILDHESGADITNQILTQIIYEQEKNKGGLFPQFMLTRLIQTGGSKLYALRESLNAFQNPFEFFNNEVKNRFDILLVEGQITTEEKFHFANLLLDARFWDMEPLKKQEEIDEDVSLKEISKLLDQIEQMENEVKQLKQEKDSNEDLIFND